MRKIEKCCRNETSSASRVNHRGDGAQPLKAAAAAVVAVVVVGAAAAAAASGAAAAATATAPAADAR